jgi:hypothetical protein
VVLGALMERKPWAKPLEALRWVLMALGMIAALA